MQLISPRLHIFRSPTLRSPESAVVAGSQKLEPIKTALYQATKCVTEWKCWIYFLRSVYLNGANLSSNQQETNATYTLLPLAAVFLRRRILCTGALGYLTHPWPIYGTNFTILRLSQGQFYGLEWIKLCFFPKRYFGATQLSADSSCSSGILWVCRIVLRAITVQIQRRSFTQSKKEQNFELPSISGRSVVPSLVSWRSMSYTADTSQRCGAAANISSI